MEYETSEDKVEKIFCETWKELVGEYPSARTLSTFCTESDLEVNLAHKLMNRLPPNSVHTQLPIPMDAQFFEGSLRYTGRSIAKKVIKPDIVIMDPLVPKIHLIAELKFTPVYWSYMAFYLAKEGGLTSEALATLKGKLQRDVEYLRGFREKPNLQDLRKAYLSNVPGMVRLLENFESVTGERIACYLCIVDEIYPDIQKLLSEIIGDFDRQARITIMTTHVDIYESMKQLFKEI